MNARILKMIRGVLNRLDPDQDGFWSAEDPVEPDQVVVTICGVVRVNGNTIYLWYYQFTGDFRLI